MNKLQRRDFIIALGAAVVAPSYVSAHTSSTNRSTMYGLIGKITAVEGQRDALIDILLDGVARMPGCLSYVVAKDREDADALWVSEVWESKASHEESLTLPAVKEAMAKGRPLIAEFGERFETEPVGGHGLVSTTDQ